MDGNTITGELDQKLYNYEALTMRMRLPQGYFTIPFQGTADIALLIGIAVLVLLAFVLFLLYGRDKKIIKTVEFYAPEDMTPAEVGYIIDGVVDSRDVVSLVLYWAHRGYLSIEDTGRSTFTLRKVRDMESGVKSFEKHMFKELFSSRTEVASASLKNTFYTTVNSIKKKIEESFDSDKRRVFTKTSAKLRPVTNILTALPVMVTLFLTIYREEADYIMALLMTVGLGLLIMWPVSLIIGGAPQMAGERPCHPASSSLWGACS